MFLAFKQINNCDDYEYYFEGKCYALQEGDDILGLAKCYEDGKSIYISQIEILNSYQGCGIGTKFINLLKEEFKNFEELYGIATVSSYLFWESLGCTWCNSDRFELELGDENEFSIKIN